MRALLKVLLTFLSFVFAQGQYYYPLVQLESYCDQTINLGCPDSSTSRAGKLYFYIVPLKNCTVSVQTPVYCRVSHAIYFNIPRSDFAMGDFVEVYEMQYGSNGTLLKRIPGGASSRGYSSPSSVAQLLTSYSTQHRLRFHLNLEPKTAKDYSHEVQFDYTIVRQTSRSVEGYCQALNGYVPNEIICSDSSSYDWRVSCPSVYIAAVGITNGATGQQACTLSTTTTRRTTGSFYRRTTTSSWARRTINPYGYTTTGATTTQRYDQSAQYGHIDRTFAALRGLGIAAVFLMVVIGLFLIALLAMLIMRLAGKNLSFNYFQGKQANDVTSRDGHPLWNAPSL